MSSDALRILMIAPEMVPFAKTGEVSDVVSALSQALVARGHDVRVSIPRYEHIKGDLCDLEPCGEPILVPMDHRADLAGISTCKLENGVQVYLVENSRYFSKPIHTALVDDADPFIFHGRATLEFLRQQGADWRPDVIHCHDWQTAIVANWMATVYKDDPVLGQAVTVFTVHRLSHQGIFGYRALEAAGLERDGFIYHDGLPDMDELVDLLGRGVYFADVVTTVSETYAREIQEPEYGEGLDPLFREKSGRLYGVVNGIDQVSYNPETDAKIVANFGVDSLELRVLNKAVTQSAFGLEQDAQKPLVAMISRLVDAKGLDLFVQALPDMLRYMDVQFAIIGVGETRYHDLFSDYAVRYPGRFGVRLSFDDAMERQLYAGADMYLRPARVEACGLGQMLAMRYGAVPVVRATGGLADTVENYQPQTGKGHGFCFDAYEAMALYTAVVRATEVYAHRDVWQRLQHRCMSQDFSWSKPASRYEMIYRQIIDERNNGAG